MIAARNGVGYCSDMWALAPQPRTARAVKSAVSDCIFVLILFPFGRIGLGFRPAEMFACMVYVKVGKRYVVVGGEILIFGFGLEISAEERRI